MRVYDGWQYVSQNSKPSRVARVGMSNLSALLQSINISISEVKVIYLLSIHSISFNVIQPMWLCRQIPTHKIADMPKRRNQANKQKR
jgi:hypothetical protein